jgi:hypothetical protein
MINLGIFYSKLITVGLIILLGFILGRTKFITETANKQLTNLLLSIAMPASLFIAFPRETQPPFSKSPQTPHQTSPQTQMMHGHDASSHGSPAKALQPHKLPTQYRATSPGNHSPMNPVASSIAPLKSTDSHRKASLNPAEPRNIRDPPREQALLP